MDLKRLKYLAGLDETGIWRGGPFLPDVAKGQSKAVPGLVDLVHHMDGCQTCAEEGRQRCPDAQEIVRENDLESVLKAQR